MVKQILAQGLKTLEQVEQLVLPWLHSYQTSQGFVSSTYKTRNSHKLKEFEEIDLVLQHQKRYLECLSQGLTPDLPLSDRPRIIADVKYRFLKQLRLVQLGHNQDLLDFVAKVDWVMEKSGMDLTEWIIQEQQKLVYQSRQIHARFLQLLGVNDREHQLVDITNQGIHCTNSALESAKEMLYTMEDLPTFRISYTPPIVKEARTHGYQFPQGLLRIKVEAKLCQLANLYLRHQRPVQFMMGGETAMKELFHRLRSIPSLILGGELSGHWFALNHVFWGMNWHEYRAQPLMPAIPWLEIAIKFAQREAVRWQEQQTNSTNSRINGDFL
ncbi:MAG: hypothetical protein HC796_11100, partial [Synechococcaceae cyanobacterium RL_1_2]|nr:hypothetical protein [Synechococcaceae cyanobacterium RL_1_2]